MSATKPRPTPPSRAPRMSPSSTSSTIALIPNAMEPRAALGRIRFGDRRHHALIRRARIRTSRALVLSAFDGVAPEHKLRVIAPDVGGGFGSKIFIYNEETVCAWAAKKLDRHGQMDRRPQRVVPHRRAWTRSRHPRRAGARRRAARSSACRVHTIANLGAYPSTFWSSVPTYLYAILLSGQYDIPAIYAEVDAVYTNTVSVDAVRGAGRPEATFLVERIVEKARARTGPRSAPSSGGRTSSPNSRIRRRSSSATTPATIRRRSTRRSSSPTTRASPRARRPRPPRQAARLGFSAYIEACGLAPSQAVGSLGAGVGLWESAEVRVNPVGTVEVLTGSHSHGQGHETTFAQLVSERLGVPIENISIVHGDTDKVQFGMGTYGSRSGAVGMSALVEGARQGRGQSQEDRRRDLLEAAERRHRIEGRQVHRQRHRQVDGLRFGRAQRLYPAQVQHGGTRARAEGNRVLGSAELHLSRPACTSAEVEIDPETGK